MDRISPETPGCGRPTPTTRPCAAAAPRNAVSARRSGMTSSVSALLCQEIQPVPSEISGQLGCPRCQAARTRWVSSGGGSPADRSGASHTARLMPSTCQPSSLFQAGASTSAASAATGVGAAASCRSSPNAACSCAAWVPEFSSVWAQAASNGGRASSSSAWTCWAAPGVWAGTAATSRAHGRSPGPCTSTLTCSASGRSGTAEARPATTTSPATSATGTLAPSSLFSTPSTPRTPVCSASRSAHWAWRSARAASGALICPASCSATSTGSPSIPSSEMFSRWASASLDGPATALDTSTADAFRSQARFSAVASDHPPVAASACSTISECGVLRRSRSKVSARTTCSTLRPGSARCATCARTRGSIRISSASVIGRVGWRCLIAASSSPPPHRRRLIAASGGRG